MSSGGRAAIDELWHADERDCVPPLIAAAELAPDQAERAGVLARSLILGARSARSAAERLLGQLALDTPAGAALLTLAEALLRVPDAANADRLISDQLGSVDWRGSGMLGSLARAMRVATLLSPPLLRAALRLGVRQLGGQFIFAQSIQAALRRARRRRSLYRYSFDMLGEAAVTAEHAQRYFADYEHAIRAVGEAFTGDEVSVKLSALHPRYGYARRGRILAELLPRLRQLARSAQRHRIALAIDAEEAERLDVSIDLIEALIDDQELADWSGLSVAVQAYQKRAPALIDYLAVLARRRRHRLMIRLVKGAYWDLEIKLAQLQGLSGYPVYTRKPYTDVAYLACARRLLATPQLAPQFATHNARTIAEIIELSAGTGAALEFQCLHGMGGGLYRELLSRPGLVSVVRVYAPVGDRAALLPYMMRRLLENGASSSFVHRAAHAPLQALCADPVHIAARWGGRPHPKIPLPCELFAPWRRNSAGMDLADSAQRAPLLEALAQRAPIDVGPILARPAAGPAGRALLAAREIRNPADRAELLGTVREADEADVEAALQAAVLGARSWGQTPIQTRAQLLEGAAELLEQRSSELVSLTVREAGKTLANGLAEVREAVDSLRYYAAQIRAEFDTATHVPLGPVVCISPWNFPLAIFTGQIAAALAAGNSVLAKPAEQTAATAALVVAMLREAGIAPDALQLLPGAGQRVGLRLVSDARVRGVVFTGSTLTARTIARALASRGAVPLIAETGGQNAMIVDSTALPEQVVSDVLRSAFDSAGQRCSSLRVLCLQEEIAATTLRMLEGAMAELRVGNPALIETDVGPLIDESARERIQAHVSAMRARMLCQSPLSEECARGVFLAPTLLQLDSIAELHGEVFGPVLHVVRYDRRRLEQLLDDINATGYGLTLGVASRIGSTTARIIERARVGNVYVNRNMIGAVIGVQPFGGEGLSGTGPKAGGPLYLHAMLERSPGPQLAAPAARAPQGLAELIDWLQQGGAGLPAAECERLRVRAESYAARTPLGLRCELSGYVGETNVWRLRARGALRASARGVGAALEQLAAALATGNRVRIDDPELATRLARELPPSLRAQLGDREACQVLLIDATEATADPAWAQQLRCQSADGEGPIVPLVMGSATEGYPLTRLLVEQTVSINTAAVGGDARLLALQDEDQASE